MKAIKNENSILTIFIIMQFLLIFFIKLYLLELEFINPLFIITFDNLDLNLQTSFAPNLNELSTMSF